MAQGPVAVFLDASVLFKDAPHFATALKAKVDCLVSLDRKHMIDIREEVYADLRLRILLPSELLSELRELFDQRS
jgi:predicted nucleic acid-binding protein